MKRSLTSLVKKSTFIAMLSTAAICNLTMMANAQMAQIDFKDSVIATYENALILRSLPKIKGNPDYNRLISECRFHLYNSMKFAAISGDWPRAQEFIPAAEVCSYTGKVLPTTTAEYQAHWQQAMATANSLPKPQGAAPEPIAAPVEVKSPVKEPEIKPEPLDDGCRTYEEFESDIDKNYSDQDPKSLHTAVRLSDKQNLSLLKNILKPNTMRPMTFSTTSLMSGLLRV